MGVITGALAVVRKNGTPIARIRNITAEENTARGEVRGLGTILTIEAPALTHGGTWSCEFYEEFFETTGIPQAIRRDVQTNRQFEDQIVADSEDGFQIDIFKRVEDAVDADTGLFTLSAVPYAILKRCHLERDGFNIGEANIGSHSQSGRFLDPIIYPS